jgi:HEAT repeat protein
MTMRGWLIAVAWLALVGCLSLFAKGTAAAQDEPQFLGHTRVQWIDTLEFGQRRQRSYAAWAIQEFALQQLDNDNALLWLNELLLMCENPNASVRYWGAFGLGRLVGKLDADVPVRIKALEVLPTLLKDSSAAVRIAAADALQQSSERAAALAVLVESLSNPQEAVRIQAATALAHWGEAARPATATLRQATSDPSEYVKRIATRTLAGLESRSP